MKEGFYVNPDGDTVLYISCGKKYCLLEGVSKRRPYSLWMDIRSVKKLFGDWVWIAK